MDSNPHSCSIRMELAARRLLGGLERYDLDGLLDSDVFDREPYIAALNVLKIFRNGLPHDAQFMADRYILQFEDSAQPIVHGEPAELDLDSRVSLADAFDVLVDNLIETVP